MDGRELLGPIAVGPLRLLYKFNIVENFLIKKDSGRITWLVIKGKQYGNRFNVTR